MALSPRDNFKLPKDWQMGKTLLGSTSCLMSSEKHADVWFCCKDQDKSVQTDRVAAHKLILACRSPVFEVMFYGEMAESKCEISLPDIEKIPLLLFLRFLYTDTTDLLEQYAIDVMLIAHKYQVTTCFEFCSKYLREVLRPDNVCCFLGKALLLEDKVLEKAVIDFIDDHVPAVIDSEEFKTIERDTLAYMLKGNTFFAPEVEILKAVDGWATYHLECTDTEVNPVNKRIIMGDVFQYLRLPTMSLRQFVMTQLEYAYLTTEEEKNISRFILEKDKNVYNLCTSCEPRVPRKVTCFMPVLQCWEVKDISSRLFLTNQVKITCKNDVELDEILFSFKLKPAVEAKCTIEVSLDTQSVAVKEACLRQPNITCHLQPPVSLYAVRSPYKIKVTVQKTKKQEMLLTSGGLFTSVPVTRSVHSGFGVPVTTAAFFGSAPTAALYQRVNKFTQTYRENDCSENRISVFMSLDNTSEKDCFIHGVKYTNKSNRD